MSSVRASAVFVGVVVDFVSSIAGGMLWGIVQGIRGARQGLAPEAITATMQGDGALFATFGIGIAGTLLGGHVAARMGRNAPLAQGAGVGVAQLLIGALFLGMGHAGAYPTWYYVAGFLAVVPAALLGAAMVERSPAATSTPATAATA